MTRTRSNQVNRSAAARRRLALALGTSVASLLGFGAAAHAQALRPNILILFDTSGSMLYNQSNDGSPLCNNSANGQTSRIYNMKHALRDALAEVGTDEANFGLMRFPQTLNTSQADNCPNAFWSNSGTSVSGNIGCRMTTQSDNPNSQTTYGSWFDTGVGQALVIPVTLASTGLKPNSGTDYDPAGANISSIYRWIDQTESNSATNYTDPELRIPPNNNTPLGRSLFYARLYFENYVYPKDPKAGCRQNIVIVATDGAETCDTKVGTSLDTTTCAQTGTYGTFSPEVSACAMNHSTVIPKGVQTYILTDSGLTNSEKAAANRIAAAGGTGQAIFVSLTDTNAVKTALVNIIAQNVPPPELCNGKDENCNALIDEGVSNACSQCVPGNTIAACAGFSYSPNDPNDADNKAGANAHHCAAELKNCLDDNCNGQIDEGFPPNRCGGPGGCPLPAEVCDGQDNDCDGIVDNGNFSTGPVGTKCNNGLKGACNRDGTLVCNATGNDTVCSAPIVTPQQEVCNGIDDNCDGQIDEGTLPGVGEKCGNGLGMCQSGTIICKNGKLVCNAVSMPQPEVCDGIDNDCNGVIDDGNFPETGTPCLCPGLTQAQVDVGGICQAGKLKCMGMMGFVCAGCVLPTQGEVCNGKDNNCDGKVDTTGNCPNGYACKDGACTLQCSGGEFPCPPSYKCVNNYCIPQRCATVTCPSGQRCDEATGSCVDNCANVSCTLPSVCVNGACVDCNQLGCEAGKMCLGGVCIEDKCKGVTCGPNQYCDNGACQDLCNPDKCGPGQTCIGNQCADKPCAGMFCTNGTYCDSAAGSCLPDKCLAIQCGAGKQCVSSKATQSPNPATACEVDPCATINCPSDCWSCTVDQNTGTGSCQLDTNKCQSVNAKVGQRGGGESGCSCEVGGGPGRTGWLALAMGLVLIAARRRKTR